MVKFTLGLVAIIVVILTIYVNLTSSDEEKYQKNKIVIKDNPVETKKSPKASLETTYIQPVKKTVKSQIISQGNLKGVDLSYINKKQIYEPNKNVTSDKPLDNNTLEKLASEFGWEKSNIDVSKLHITQLSNMSDLEYHPDRNKTSDERLDIKAHEKVMSTLGVSQNRDLEDKINFDAIKKSLKNIN